MARGAGEVHVAGGGRGATTTTGTVVDADGNVLGAWAIGCVVNGGGICCCCSDEVKINGGAVGAPVWRPCGKAVRPDKVTNRWLTETDWRRWQLASGWHIYC